MLKGKNIILGISAGIAAFKAATLARLFIKAGAEVKVVMTPLAKEFITPVTMATLSKNTVLSDFFHHDDGEWNSHVDLGLWADLMVIAPATANTMAKMAHGVCDNLLITTYLSARCPVMVCPTMDLDMYQHLATQNNIGILRSYGNLIVEPDSGELASGLIGKGRMAEPEDVLTAVIDFFAGSQDLKGVKAMVTAGPTYEQIDPVRFIGNHSSGKMGFAIAEELASRGAEVTLIAGPVGLVAQHENIRRVDVVSASEMEKAALDSFHGSDVAVMCAAVADYTPVSVADCKMKSSDSAIRIELKPTTDIAKALGEKKQESQLLVGFALETHDERKNALAKMKKKNLDFIVLNSLQDQNAGFKFDTNKITILSADGLEKELPLKLKTELAVDIVDQIAGLIK